MQDDPRDVSRALLQHARELAKQCNAATILVSADVFSSPADILTLLPDEPGLKTILVTRSPQSFQHLPADSFDIIQLPNVILKPMGQVKTAVLVGFSHGKLRQGERLICLSGIPRSDSLDTLLLTRVGGESEILATPGGEQFRQQANPEVFARVLDIAISLGHEGREGRPVGAIFVVGDVEHVGHFSEPLMLNPFQGHPEEKRNILDPSLRETIKELSSLDGAFLIRDDGVVEAAGVFLRSVVPSGELPRGLGTRHRSAAAITAATTATAITVSESSGNVTVFRDGKIMTEIEKAPRAIQKAPQPLDLFQNASGVGSEEIEPRTTSLENKDNATF
jgi:diadenylate cyclase